MRPPEEPISAQVPTEDTAADAELAAREEVAGEDTAPPPQRAALVFNPVKIDEEVARAALVSASAEADWEEPLFLETSVEDPGHGMAREALEKGATVVIAAGGDGTVRAVVEAMNGSGVPVAILPAGTGNLLVRNLGLPLNDVAASMRIAVGTTRRDIDLAVARVLTEDNEDRDHVFAVMAGIGLDAQMIDQTDEDLKKKVGWLAYVQAIARVIKGPSVPVRTRIDDAEPVESGVQMLLVGNCGTLPGDVVLLPDAELDDGILDVIALRPTGLLSWARTLVRVLVDNKLLKRTQIGAKLPGPNRPIRALRYEKARRIGIDLREPEPFQLDGDTVGKIRAATIEVLPAALTVMVD